MLNHTQNYQLLMTRRIRLCRVDIKSKPSDIDPLDRNAFVPAILQNPRHLLGRLVAHHRSHKIQAGIQATRNASTGNDPQPAKSQTCSPSIALSPLHTLLPRIASLASNAFPSTIRPFGKDERIFVFILPKIKARVVHHIILLHHVSLFQIAFPRRILADDLQLGVVVWVCGRSHTLQHPSGAQDQRASADGHEGALFAWVGGLQLGEGFEEGHWFGVFLDDFLSAAAARDDEDIVFFEVVMGVSVIDICFDGKARGRRDAGGGCDDGAFEGMRC